MGVITGRPSKYNEALQAKADTYIDSLEELGHVVPSRVGLCVFLGIAKSTSQEWEQQHPAFSATLRMIETAQEQMALDGGLRGSFNSTITKLVLANHGYSERQQVDNVSSDGSMTPTKIERVVVDANPTNQDT